VTEFYKVNPCELCGLAVTLTAAIAFLYAEGPEMKNILNHFTMLAVLVAGMSPSLKAADTSTNPVSKLLAEATTNSSQISADWKAYSRQSNPDSSADAAEIARMKDDISAAMKTIASLNDSRSLASPSQAATIDQIVPVMEELADNATDAVEYLAGNQARLTDKECKEYLGDNSDTSKRLAELITRLVEFGNGRDKFQTTKRLLVELTENEK
jgi:hypothetical protein